MKTTQRQGILFVKFCKYNHKNLIKKMKNYNQAPLPFQGQKRRFLKEFKNELQEFSPTATYVDLFGGSGFLSHTVKQHYPDATVVYNDFDNYTYRLENVENTNAIIANFRK